MFESLAPFDKAARVRRPSQQRASPTLRAIRSAERSAAQRASSNRCAQDSGAITIRPGRERTPALTMPIFSAIRLRAVLVTAGAATVIGMVVLGAAGGLAASGRVAADSPHHRARRASHILANSCFAIASVARVRFLRVAGADAYRADRRARAAAAPFYFKPTGLGTYLIYDPGRKLLASKGSSGVGRSDAPGPAAEWRPARRTKGSFAIVSTSNGRELTAQRKGTLNLTPRRPGDRTHQFELVRARGCKRFPEAQVGARGRPFRGTRRDGTAFGFSDAHLHITADLRAGGRVIHGENFDRFGITDALGGDERDHGPDGSLDTTGNLLRSGSPAGTHDTHGWPTFAGWPVRDTYTHQQTYYVWLERMWMAGMRLVVAQTVEDEPLCRLEQVKSHSCDETATIELEIARLRALERYVDAQSGGRGRGWFRLVYDPRQARRAIARGKLAVIIGMESSDALGCSEFEGIPRCTRADVDRRLDELHRLGLRGMFIAHWIDNAFAGAAFEPGATGEFISGLQVLQTGRPFISERCTEGDEADGRCNSRGLTDLGQYLVERLMARHMLIEVDHLSQKARKSVLAITRAHHYPVISSHTGTGGEWTPAQLKELYAAGGLASADPEEAPALAAKILRLGRYRSPGHYFGVGLGSDTGGFNALPAPRADARAHPLRYPFKSYDGKVRFMRERTGTRVFDLNTDGVAHYGLFADLIADMQRRRDTRRALRPLFRSAEAYLQMWERTTARG